MKLHAIVLVMSLISVSFAQGQGQALRQNTKDEKAVWQTERELLQARIEGDKNSLNRLLAANYLSSDSLTKQDVIKDVKPMSNTSFDTSQLKVRLLGDSAEVTAVLLLKWRGGADVYSQVVDRLVKRPMGWQAVSSNKEMMPI
ncbi:MAG: nuclear transport factor 2 family protein [Segetibacter sp.]